LLQKAHKGSACGADCDSEEIHASIPYLVYQNKNPFMRDFDEDYYQGSEYNKWTETRFFKYSQLQECIASEYSDQFWTLSQKSKKMLTRDLGKALDEETDDNFQFKLGLQYIFTRKNPKDAKTIKKTVFKTLNTTNLYDCHTAKQLQVLTDMDCDQTPTAKASVVFYEVYNPNLILGNTQNIEEVQRKGRAKEDMLHDLKLTFECPGSWILEGS
jgi:hypothetical protein